MIRAKRTEGKGSRKATALRLVETGPATTPEALEYGRLWRAAHPLPSSSLHEKNVARVIDAALWGDAGLVQRMADLAIGARKPGQSFDARIVQVVELVKEAQRSPRPEIEIANVVNHCTLAGEVPLFQGLERSEALELVKGLLAGRGRKRLAASGIAARLVHAAIGRGVDLGHGCTFGKASENTAITKAIDAAVARARDYST